MTGVLCLGDTIEVPWMTVLWPYDEEGGQPLPQAEVTQMCPMNVRVRWLSNEPPRGHAREEMLSYGDVRRVAAHGDEHEAGRG